jgi:hypothetical protein
MFQISIIKHTRSLVILLKKLALSFLIIGSIGLFLMACGTIQPTPLSPTATSTSTSEPISTHLTTLTPTPDLFDLLETYPSLETALANYKIDVQCSFPATDITNNAATITQLTDQLPMVEVALISITPTSAVSQLGLICDLQTGQVYFANPDAESYLLATSIGLMPATMENSNLSIVLPGQEAGSSQSPAAFTHPEYIPATGDAIPDFLTQKDPKNGRSIWMDEVDSIHLALNIKGIDPQSVNIKFLSWLHSIVTDTGAIEYRWGTVIESKDNPNVIYWAKYDDGAKEFTPRPDMRPASRPWHYGQLTIPNGLGDTVELRAYFPPGAEGQFVYLLDTSQQNSDQQPKVIAMFKPTLGEFRDMQGQELAQIVPDYYPGVAPSLEAFPEIKITDIPTIISDLRSKPSLLADADNPVPIEVFQGARFIGVTCNADVVNCEVAASAKVIDEGQWRYLAFIEVRNVDGSRGYLTTFIYDGIEKSTPKLFQFLLNDPHPMGAFCLRQGLGDPKHQAELEQKYPYSNHLLHQPDYQELLSEVLETGTIPAQLESTIILLTFFGASYH